MIPCAVGARFRALLEDHGVTALYSPPHAPRYNGACEAGIGGLKTRVRHLAWQHEALCASRTSEPGRSRLALERRTAISRALLELGYPQIKSRHVSLSIASFFPADTR